MDNPLLEPEGLPAFSRIRPEHVAPAVREILQRNREGLRALLAATPAPDWDRLVPALDEMDEALHRAWAPVAHLQAVRNTPELRQAYNQLLPEITDYETELGQHPGLYAAFRALAESPGFAALDPAQRKYVQDALRDFRLAGVHLPKDEKQRFRAIMQRLAELQTRFEEHLLDATDAWRLQITDPARLAGVPAADRARFAARAREQNLDGWLLGLDFPGYHAVITFADDRGLREQIYRAYVTRASEFEPGAPRDNAPLMREILALRTEAARLLGHASYAEYSLADKMADSPEAVLRFLENLAARIKPRAAAEYAELERFARRALGLESLQAWDVAWAGEKLREHRFGLRQEELKPYFPVPVVLRGLFALLKRLYGLEIHETGGADTWHPDVRFLEVRDAAGALRGHLYVDLYARPQKRSGAWMDEALNRLHRGGRLQHPVAHLVCNFAPPVDDRPSLLSHEDVLTLFHECGHCLHHLLTRVDVAGLAGIHGVEWDAVELPSQFLENFAWQREVLDLISGHVDNGAALPAELFEKLVAGRHFHTGLKLVRQLEFALFDMRLHSRVPPPEVETTLAEVRREVAVVRPPDWNRFANSFSHVFAGGYAAGYYSYLWAEVMSSDAFAAFEEEGIFNPDTGRRFLETILEKGGSAPAAELFRHFRGREASLDAFLRHHGIEEQAA